MTYGQIVGLTFIVFGQIMVLMLVSRFASLISVLAHEDIQKHYSYRIQMIKFKIEASASIFFFSHQKHCL